MIYSPYDMSKTEISVRDAVMIVVGWCCTPYALDAISTQ